MTISRQGRIYYAQTPDGAKSELIWREKCAVLLITANDSPIMTALHGYSTHMTRPVSNRK